jgi:hypothetical protein
MILDLLTSTVTQDAWTALQIALGIYGARVTTYVPRKAPTLPQNPIPPPYPPAGPSPRVWTRLIFKASPEWWRGVLTPAQRAAWNAFAPGVAYQTFDQTPGKQKGYYLFGNYNLTRWMEGFYYLPGPNKWYWSSYNFRSDPPAAWSKPPAPTSAASASSNKYGAIWDLTFGVTINQVFFDVCADAPLHIKKSHSKTGRFRCFSGGPYTFTATLQNQLIAWYNWYAFGPNGAEGQRIYARYTCLEYSFVPSDWFQLPTPA